MCVEERTKARRSCLAAAFALVLSVSVAAASGDFSGRWRFDVARSTNSEPMAHATIVSTITQGPTKLTDVEHSDDDGKSQDNRNVYDLTGQPKTHRTITGARVTAITYWDRRRLVTEWEIRGTMFGSRAWRREARYLSPDGRTMYLELSRAGEPTQVLVFDRMP